MIIDAIIHSWRIAVYILLLIIVLSVVLSAVLSVVLSVVLCLSKNISLGAVLRLITDKIIHHKYLGR